MIFSKQLMGKLHKLRTLKNLTPSVPLSMSWRGGSQAQRGGGEVNVRPSLRFNRAGRGMRAFTILLIACFTLPPVRSIQAQPDSRVARLLASMTLEQRVGQLFMVSVYGKGMGDTTSAFLQEMMPGGVALFTSNVGGPEETTSTVNAWQTAATQIGARVPLLVAVDQEGATVARLVDGFTLLPAGWTMAAMPPEDARRVGQIVAEELRAVGVRMNLAPVTDVQTIKSNPLMDRRTFGSDPNRVGAAAAAINAGMAERGVIGVLKHFPGHGDAGDSHAVLPQVDDSRERVESVELQSFRVAIQAGAEVVMLGHLVYPALDPTPDLPASLSPRVINDVLRGELGFEGVAMTDAMDMGAIVDHYAHGDSAVRALNAGIDMIVTGPHMSLSDQREMRRAVLDAVARGDIPQARIDEAVTRVLMLKSKHGLLDWTALESATAAQRVNAEAHQAILNALYENMITLARNNGGLLPINAATTRVVMIYPGIYPSTQRLCATHNPGMKSLAYSQAPTDQEIASAHTLARDADVIVVFTYDAIYQPKQQALVQTLPPDKTVVVALQNPYDYTAFPEVAGYVLSYFAVPGAFNAACNVLYGVHPARGVLPVTLSDELLAGVSMH